MAKKELTKISVSTKPNGYSLTIEGEEFFYFGLIDLLAGFMTHVGTSETSELNKADILHTLFNAMIGDAYSDAVTTLKKRVGLLTQQYETTIERMDKAIEYVSNAEKQIQGMKNRVESLDQSLAGVTTDYSTAKKDMEETMKKWVQLEKKVNRTVDNLTQATTIDEERRRKEAKESESKADDSEKTDGGKDIPQEKQKGRGGRKKNDEAIIEQLRRSGQLK